MGSVARLHGPWSESAPISLYFRIHQNFHIDLAPGRETPKAPDDKGIKVNVITLEDVVDNGTMRNNLPEFILHVVDS